LKRTYITISYSSETGLKFTSSKVKDTGTFSGGGHVDGLLSKKTSTLCFKKFKGETFFRHRVVIRVVIVLLPVLS